MTYSLPHKIKNHLGEELIFHRIETEDGEEKLIIENYVAPDSPPIRHTYLQDEYLVVLHGKLGYQIEGGEPQYATIGQTAFFKKGVQHKFWNAGKDELNCFGWIKPAKNVVVYLTALYESLNKAGRDKPAKFDSAYLLHHYPEEFDIPLPKLAKSIVLPATYGIGKLMGKYKKYNESSMQLSS
jgi:quercetin dioxygenase-like cupin family protein